MVGGLKIVRVKTGHEAEFESLFKQLRMQMHQSEPGCILYSLLKSRTDPLAYFVHEQYINQAALDAHQISPYGKILFLKMRAILESITVEYFDGVVE
jgi:quinol monooxygenase YgiN